MKKTALLLVFCFSVISSFAQTTNKSIIPIINQTNDYISLIEKKYEKQVVHLEYDVIKTSKESYRQLFGGVQYGIILFGDENIKNISLNISVIKDNNWKIIKTENSNEGIVMLYFTPDKTDFYRFDFSAGLQNPKSYAYYGFLLFR